MVRKLALAALAAAVILITADTASARGRRCGGGGCGSSCGGCGSGGSCGYGYGGCGYAGGCGYGYGGGSGGGCGVGGHGYGGYGYGGYDHGYGAGYYAVTQPASSAATLVVTLPAEAKLTIDDQATSSTSERRVFTTPELPGGRDYHYTLKAEITRDGKVETVTRQVAVRAGGQTDVRIDFPVSVAAR